MEELTIKEEDIKTEEFILGIKEENYILMEDGISQDVQAKYEQDNDLEMTIVKHEFLEDDRYDYSNYNESDCSYPTKDYARSSHECKKFKLVAHEGLVIADSDKQFKCAECKFSSKYKHSLKDHIQARHRKVKPFKCSECDYSCAMKGTLIRHVGAVHGNRKLFKCSVCQRQCKTKNHLKSHIIAAHCIDRTFKCSECDFISTKKGPLMVHIKTVHNKKKKGKDANLNS